MNIAIASGKGGTGKTTLAVNLAWFIRSHHKKPVDDIVLVDLDVEEPNSGLFLSGELIHEETKFKKIPSWIEDKCSFCGKCHSVCQFNAIIQLPELILIYPDFCHSCHACSGLCPEQALQMIDHKIGTLKHYKILDDSSSGSSFSIVESILEIGEPLPVPLIRKTKEYVEDNFSESSLKIFDCPPGNSCSVIEAVKDVDFTILVTEPTPFGLHDLELAVETMRQLDIKFGVVVNQYGIGNDDVIQYCNDEKINILAKIPHDRNIAERYAIGDILFPTNNGISKEMENIYSSVV